MLLLKCESFQQTDLSNVRGILCGGSKLSISTALNIAKKLTNGCVYQSYGMSEVGGTITLTKMLTEQQTWLGRLCHGIQAKVIDDDGNRLGANEEGEICLKMKYNFLGYYENEEASQNAIDDDGFLKTGDVGYIDECCQVHLVDRKKEMMKYCSSQISPTEIEHYLVQHTSIRSACVVGIPDSVVGDLPAAVIVRNHTEGEISSEEVEEMIAGKRA